MHSLPPVGSSTRQGVASTPPHDPHVPYAIPQGGGGDGGKGGTPSYVLDPPFFFSLKDAPVLFENEYGKLQGPNNSDLPVLDEVNMKVGCRGGGWGRRGEERKTPGWAGHTLAMPLRAILALLLPPFDILLPPVRPPCNRRYGWSCSRARSISQGCIPMVTRSSSPPRASCGSRRVAAVPKPCCIT